MKKFSFRFKTLETIRKATENLVLAELGRAQRVLEYEKNLKQKLDLELQSALKARESPAQVLEYQLWDQRILGLKQSILRSMTNIMKAQKLVDRCTERYHHAKKNVKVLEVLKEKDIAEFKQQKNRYLQRQSDDLTVMRFSLNREDSQ
jgi:flagellar export protein FliJ